MLSFAIRYYKIFIPPWPSRLSGVSHSETFKLLRIVTNSDCIYTGFSICTVGSDVINSSHARIGQTHIVVSATRLVRIAISDLETRCGGFTEHCMMPSRRLNNFGSRITVSDPRVWNYKRNECRCSRPDQNTVPNYAPPQNPASGANSLQIAAAMETFTKVPINIIANSLRPAHVGLLSVQHDPCNLLLFR